MLNLKTGKHFTDSPNAPLMTRGGFLRGILATGIAPSISLGAVALAGSANASVGRGMMRNIGARNATMFGGGSAVVNHYQTTDNALWMMYNGAWNSGLGKYSETATSIVDCMGHEAPLEAGSVGDNKMWRETKSLTSVIPSQTLGQMIYNKVFSVMFIGRVAKRSGGQQDLFAFYNGSSRGVSLNCLNNATLSPYLYRSQFSGATIYPTWDSNNEVVFAWVFTFDGSVRIQRYREIGGVVSVDYELISSSALFSPFVPSALKFGYETKCEIGVFAVYNRALSIGEFNSFWDSAKTQFGLVSY